MAQKNAARSGGVFDSRLTFSLLLEYIYADVVLFGRKK